MCTQENEVRLAVQVADGGGGGREKSLRSHVEDHKGAVLVKSEAVLDVNKATKDYWREKLTTTEMPHVMERCTASRKLEKSFRN